MLTEQHCCQDREGRGLNYNLTALYSHTCGLTVRVEGIAAQSSCELIRLHVRFCTHHLSSSTQAHNKDVRALACTLLALGATNAPMSSRIDLRHILSSTYLLLCDKNIVHRATRN